MEGGHVRRRGATLGRDAFVAVALLVMSASAAVGQATPTPRPARVVIGVANALAGTDVDIPVALDPGDQNVFRVQNDIQSDLITPVRRTSPGGPPDCIANGSLGFTSVLFTCLDADCLKIRAIVQRQGGAPLPPGIIYTCTYSVDPSAMPAFHPLAALAISITGNAWPTLPVMLIASASSGWKAGMAISITGNVGQALPAAGDDGAIHVVLELPP